MTQNKRMAKTKETKHISVCNCEAQMNSKWELCSDVTAVSFWIAIFLLMWRRCSKNDLQRAWMESDTKWKQRRQKKNTISE